MAATLLTPRCNIFGGEGSTVRNLGGLGATPTTNWFCPNPSDGRFRMECAHGHKGQIMLICRKHYAEFANRVEFCPRCNMVPPGHKCKLRIRGLS